MRNYEVAYIASSDLDEDALNGLEARLTERIEAGGGKVLDVDRWGRRRLAYPIHDRPDGVYIFIRSEMPPHATGEVEHDLRLNENVLRYLITLQDRA